MKREENLAPIMRQIAIWAVICISAPLLVALKQIARKETEALYAMGFVTVVAIAALAWLFSDHAKNLVIRKPSFKAPAKKDNFVS